MGSLLNKAVQRVINRVVRCSEPFGVFIFGQRITLVKVNSVYYQKMYRQCSDCYVGTYNRDVLISELIDDLRIFIKEEEIAHVD